MKKSLKLKSGREQSYDIRTWGSINVTLTSKAVGNDKDGWVAWVAELPIRPITTRKQVNINARLVDAIHEYQRKTKRVRKLILKPRRSKP